MNFRSVYRWLNWALVAVLLACAIWMAYETTRPGHSHYGLYRSTANETIVIKPGRAVIAYYAFLVTLSLIPAAWLLRMAATTRSSVARTAGVISVMATALIAGFAYETLQTEIRLTLSAIGYRAGGQTVQMGWAEVQVMAFRNHSRSQWIELLGPRDLIIRIDLGPFAQQDKLLLIDQLPRIARLSLGPRKLPDGWVWRRSSGIQIPD